MFASTLPLLPLVLDDVPWALRQMLVQEGLPHIERDRRNALGRFLLFDSRNGPLRRPRAGQIAIDVELLRAAFDEDPFREWSDHRTQRFEWQVGPLRPSEEIARVDKRALRRGVMARLQEELERRGGVWIGLAPYPFPYRSAFNWRIDYDEFDERDFARLQFALSARADAVSHFVNGSAYEGRLDWVRQLAGQDVGSHGYWHHTYRTYEENLRNIERGIRVLEEAGLRPAGFTAPGGRFNRSLLKALERLEIGHSSEFALAYDELPLLPAGSSVLQIPVHPVCLGIVLEAARSDQRRQAAEAAREYFTELVHAKIGSGEPVFLYGHPTGRLGRYPEVVEGVFREIEGRADVWAVTMSAWAEWWRARRRIQLTVMRDGDGYSVELVHKPVRQGLAIEYRRGAKVARLPLEAETLRFSPTAVEYRERQSAAIARPERVDSRHGLRGRVRRWVDWERETPVEEIAPTTLRNVAKRTLRTLWR